MKMEATGDRYEGRMRLLYEASYRGCVSTLNTLILQDPLILHRINSRTIFMETPLHVSALLGHLDFTKALLSHKPKLAIELDSFQSTPLHLASAEGHIDIVKQLLQYCDDACLVLDQEGRIPLHYAVIRGRLEVVAELIRVKPESLRILDKGKTIFHLCVTYNHLEILKSLIELAIGDTYELLNQRDMDGKNTILHLAVMSKQVETVRYLLSIPEIRELSNMENGMGYTVHEILEQIPQDLKSLEIQVILMNSGINSTERREVKDREGPTSTNVGQGMRPRKKWWKNILKHMGKWFKYNGDWLEDMRGNLSLVATVISTITFQAVINPPGGFIQQGIFNSSNTTSSYENALGIRQGPLGCLPLSNGTYFACPGEAILAFKRPSYFYSFMNYNTISFVASLGVTLLLVSGVPLKNKLVMRILSIGMIITLTSLALAYSFALYMITPGLYYWSKSTSDVNVKAYIIWMVLLGFIGLYIITYFFIWAVKTCMKMIKHLTSICPRNRNGNAIG